MKMNEGKRFEESFKNSLGKDIYYLRLNDDTGIFNKGVGLKFSTSNPFDCVIYKFPTLFTLELKTNKSGRFTYYSEKFHKGTGRESYNIPKHQIEGLLQSSKYEGIVAGFILNFRNVNKTYFWHINDFINTTDGLTKKSINLADVEDNNGILIKQRLKRVNYDYDMEGFINEYISKSC